MKVLSPESLFELAEFPQADIFEGCEFAWQALAQTGAYIRRLFAGGLEPVIHVPVPEGAFITGEVYVGPGTHIEPGAFIQGPAIIGQECEIRQGAYIRGNVIVGHKAVVGHTTELKNAIFLNGAQAGHFAYVGDSILGNRVNLGAGSKLANLPVLSVKDPVTGRRPTIKFRLEGQEIDTGLSKLGAILGDEAQLGCNAVTSPGCVVGPRSLVYPLTSLRKGYYPPDTIIKLRQELEQVARR